MNPLDQLLDQIREEPVTEERTPTELQFLAEVAELINTDYNRYVLYLGAYNDVQNSKF